ncbi:MAG TPA: FAD-binding oxidoreductase [Rhizomicrobium sp.]|nr:FAD-binding oxidoreductase [Rhizomicrobium sp.]
MSIERSKLQWNGWGWAAHKDAMAEREDLWAWLANELGMPSLLATPARPIEDVSIAPARLDAMEREKFVSLLGADRVRDDTYERAFHARGRSYHDILHLRAGDLSLAPDAVLYPRSADEVQAALEYANERGIAVVPYGGGTSVVGGVSASSGPLKAVVALDLSGMDRLLDVDTMSGTATAEAGIYGPALEKALQAKGVTLGHYPQSYEFSTLGGWIAHRGAGQQSGRYGKAEDWLISAKIATPRGSLSTESFPKSAAGPRLTDFFIGSEGAFGIITEATFRVHAVPKESDFRGFMFRDFTTGAAAIRQAVQEELPFSMLRLSDADETHFYRAFGAIGKKEGIAGKLAKAYLDARGFGGKPSALIAVFEGDAESVGSARKRFAKIAKDLGAISIGRGPGERWRAGRFHGPYLREPLMGRGVGVDTLETATRWSNIETLYSAVRTALENSIRETAPRPGAHGIVMCHISHSYPDGASLYFTYIFPRALDGEIAQWQAIKKAASDAIAANGGTISHHHGVGEDHLPWMAQEKGALGIEILRAIKHTLDPKGILNPGKLIP